MITKLADWGEVINGLYRYVISSNIRYEIHIERHAYSTDILTAKASLYIVHNDTSKDENNNCFDRTCILSSNTVQECLIVAYEHNKKKEV